MVKFLLEKGDMNLERKYDVRDPLSDDSDNTDDDLQLTALLHGVRKGAFAIVKALLDHGADIKAKDSNGNTVLHYWVRIGGYGIWTPDDEDTDMFFLLIERGAEIGARRYDGATPLLNLYYNPGTASTKLQCLLKAGANPEDTDASGHTLLTKIIRYRQPEGLIVLLSYGVNDLIPANDSYRDDDDIQPADVYTLRDRILLEHGVNVYEQAKREQILRELSEIQKMEEVLSLVCVNEDSEPKKKKQKTDSTGDDFFCNFLKEVLDSEKVFGNVCEYLFKYDRK